MGVSRVCPCLPVSKTSRYWSRPRRGGRRRISLHFKKKKNGHLELVYLVACSLFHVVPSPFSVRTFNCCCSPRQVFNSVNLGQIFVIAMIASAIWWQSENVSDIAGAMFFISIQQAFNGLNVRLALRAMLGAPSTPPSLLPPAFCRLVSFSHPHEYSKLSWPPRQRAAEIPHSVLRVALWFFFSSSVSHHMYACLHLVF